MKKLSLYIFLVLMWCNVGSTETYDELEIRAVKKLQSEYLFCHAFYAISETAFDDPTSESFKYIIEQKKLFLKEASDIEFSLLALAGEELLDEERLFKEKIQPKLDEAFTEAWKSVDLPSVDFVKKNNKFCQEILNNSRPRIEYWIKKLQE